MLKSTAKPKGQGKEQEKNSDLILIAEDDPTFRRLLIRSLESHGFETREAENGLVAKTIFDLNRENVRLVISDIQMPELDGVSFLEHIRRSSQVPFILMTGFSEVLEIQDAYHLGANEFIPKPFSMPDMFETIHRCLNPEAVETAPATADRQIEKPNYFPVHIDEFISTSSLQSDVFVRLSEKKYVKVAHKGQQIPVERLRTYREKKVDFLHVSVEDLGKFVDFNIRLSNLAMNNKAVPRDKKARLLRNTTELLVGKFFLEDLNPDVLKPAQNLVESTLNLAADDPEMFSVFLGLQTCSDRLYAHSVAVSLYSCLIAKQHGWFSTSTQFRLSMAGLLHDIGLKELPPELIKKTRLQRDAEDTKLFESHPIRGKEIILGLRNLPEDVAQIVCQHHERVDGSGFPLASAAKTIHPLARLLGTVDSFLDLIMPIEDSLPLKPSDAFQRMMLYPHQVDMTFFRRLSELFGFSEDQFGKRDV